MKNKDKLGRFVKGHRLSKRLGKFVKCGSCNEKVYKKPFEKWTRFCSYKCYWKSLKGKIAWNKNQKPVKCLNCQKIIFRPKCLIRKRNFCSYGCYWKSKIGRTAPNKGKKNLNASRDKHWNWKGGRVVDPYGYIFIHNPTHPFCGRKGYIREHRLVMEEHIGRYIKPKEIVHHINGIKHDNRIKNLMLLKNNSEHRKLHAKLRKKAIPSPTA